MGDISTKTTTTKKYSSKKLDEWVFETFDPAFRTSCSISALKLTVLIIGYNYYYHHRQQTAVLTIPLSTNTSEFHRAVCPQSVLLWNTPGENPEWSQHDMGNGGSWKFNSMKSSRKKYERGEVPFPTFILFS